MVEGLLASPAFSGFLGSFGRGLGGSLAAPPGPSNAVSGAYGSGLDASGWSVNFSGTQSTSSSQDKSGGVPGVGYTGGGSGIASAVPWYVWAGVAGLVAWRLIRSKK